MKVLIGNSHAYTVAIQIGSQHYARCFQKIGYDVMYLAHPISPLHKYFSKAYGTDERFRIMKSGGETIGRIFHYVPYTYLPHHKVPILSMKFFLNNWHKFTNPNLAKLIKDKGFGKVDILWIDNPLYEFLTREIDYKHSVLRITDNHRGFTHTTRAMHDKMIELAKKVDLIIYTAKDLVDIYGISPTIRSKMLYVPNGVDLSLFENIECQEPEELRCIPEPRVIYVGTINYWFDEDLVFYCAKNLPNHSFVIIGPPERRLEKLKNLKNVYLLGAKPNSRTPCFLKHSQIGIIPFDVNNYGELIRTVNPVKLYEYLAAGLKVVSVRWKELENFEKYIFLCKTKEEFLEAIKTPRNDKEKLDLTQYTWEYNLKRVLEILGK
ncbi:MAG: glycosyltransferase [Thermodesulfovibrio sp.]|nr:glycosyltransferase [Thermodesulfovibrio sp.]